jgi:hypothetical protein
MILNRNSYIENKKQLIVKSAEPKLTLGIQGTLKNLKTVKINALEKYL